MNSSKINIALIGLGRFGLKRLKSLQTDSRFKVKGIFDTRSNLDLPQNIYKFNSIEEIVKDEEITHVIVGTPNNHHWECIQKFKNRGIRVICEKPIVITPQELEELSKTQKPFFRMCSNLTYFPTSIFIKKLIPLIYNQISSIDFSIGVEQDLSINDWRFNKKVSGGGSLIDNGIHLFYLLDEILPNTEFVSSSLEKDESLDIDIESLSVLKSDKFPISIFSTWKKNIDGYVNIKITTTSNHYIFKASDDLIQKLDLHNNLIKEVRLKSSTSSICLENNHLFIKPWCDKHNQEKSTRVMSNIFRSYQYSI